MKNKIDENKTYYEFDDLNKEIVFKRIDTPQPWMNFLTNDNFFTMMSHAGGNLSWYKSPEIWRIGRYPFFNAPTDNGGLFIYIKDLETNKTWNPTFIPSYEKLDSFESRHGMGYTKFISIKDGLKAEVVAFVGKDDALIYKIVFTSNKDKSIQLFTLKEMGNMEFLREAQWECYTRNSHNIRYKKDLDTLVYNYFIDCQNRPDETPDVFFTSTMKSTSYTAQRKDFLGMYRDFRNPLGIEKGILPNTELLGGEGTFSFSYDILLKKNEPFEISFILGTIPHGEDYFKIVEKFKNKEYIDDLFVGLKQKWEDRLSKFQVKTNNKDFDRMVNIWNPYQVYNVFNICREISYYATGTVRGMGVRDASQDAVSNAMFDLDSTKERIIDILLEQYKCGKTNHYYYHKENKPSLVSDRSDNHLWIIYTIYQYIMESGDLSILDIEVPYYDEGKGTILDHINASLDYTMNHLGSHKIPLMLGSDWNDCLNTVAKKGKGESVMVAEQLVLAAKEMQEIAKLKHIDGTRYKEIADFETKVLNDVFFSKDHYVRATTDSGFFIGLDEAERGRIWINSNTWAVLANVSDTKRGNLAMDAVMNNLNTEVGLVKLYPPLVPDYPSKEEEISWATPGIGENGGVFCHANTWAIMANCMLNRGNDAFKVYDELIPDHVISKVGVERYICEPFIYSSNIRALYAERGGEAAVSWVTGTSTWMYIAATEYILGIKPKFDALEINPVLPDSIKTVHVTRKFQGSTYEIDIINEGKGSHKIYLDDKEIDGMLIKPNKKILKVKCYI